MIIKMRLKDRLGTPLEVELNEGENYLEALRMLGKQGITGFKLTPNPLILPYSSHDDFDWSLIGARHFKINDEFVVRFDGHYYKQRVFDEEIKGSKKLAAAIKYSRGALNGDPDELIEKSGEFEYVTLIIFKGGGVDTSFDVPTSTRLTSLAIRQQDTPKSNQAPKSSASQLNRAGA